MSRWLNRIWYKSYLSPLLWLLLPLTWLFILLSSLRRLLFLIRIKKVYRAPVPVIVVGNISVGGTGKTPLTIALVEELKAHGFRPGIVSRGYGGAGPFPQSVSAESATDEVGDEPYMLHAVTGVPVVVSPKRAKAAAYLLEHHNVNVILSDDGLQHYALGRDIEIAVVDATRKLGNGWRLPCGPLRESQRRLNSVDYVCVNGASSGSPSLPNLNRAAAVIPMQIKALGWHRVSNQEPIETPDGESVIAVAGIGNPARFFDILVTENLHISETRVFADHHNYQATDFYNVSNLYPLVMTEKDAVKCRSFARPHWYYLRVGAVLPNAFLEPFINRVREHTNDT